MLVGWCFVETHGRASLDLTMTGHAAETHGEGALDMHLGYQRRLRMYPMDAMPVKEVCENELTPSY